MALHDARPAPAMAPDLEPVEIRSWVPADEDELLACHNAVFADPARGVPVRTRAHWRWQYLDNPAGRMQSMLAVHPRAGVLGVYGAMPVRISVNGRRSIAAHAVDHCVRPDWLKHGGEHGLFTQLGRAYLERWLGTAAEQAMFVYGLPVTGWRSGSTHLGWQIVRDWDLTFHEFALDAAERPAPRDLVVRAVARCDADADELFTRLEPSLGLATVRDQRYLDWRYADHPDRGYTLFECRERATGRLRGLCVYGLSNVVRRQTSCLLDWLAPADDVDTTVAMLAAVERQARADGTGLVASVWNHMDPRFLLLQQHGYRVRGTQWFLAVASPIYDAVFFREQWYFTLGDSDLV